MTQMIRRILQVATVILFALLLWRFFPFVVGFIEAAALDIRRFWWVILLLGLALWVAMVLKKRNPPPP